MIDLKWLAFLRCFGWWSRKFMKKYSNHSKLTDKTLQFKFSEKSGTFSFEFSLHKFPLWFGACFLDYNKISVKCCDENYVFLKLLKFNEMFFGSNCWDFWKNFLERISRILNFNESQKTPKKVIKLSQFWDSKQKIEFPCFLEKPIQRINSIQSIFFVASFDFPITKLQFEKCQF